MTRLQSSYTVTELAQLWGCSRRQALRRLIAKGVVEPGGRGKKNRIPLERLLGAFGAELRSAALVESLGGQVGHGWTE